MPACTRSARSRASRIDARRIDAGDAAARAQRASCPPTSASSRSTTAPAGFHARFSADRQDLRVPDRQRALVSPFIGRYAWHVPQPLDVDGDAAGGRGARRRARFRRVPGDRQRRRDHGAHGRVDRVTARRRPAGPRRGRWCFDARRRRLSPPHGAEPSPARWSTSGSGRWPAGRRGRDLWPSRDRAQAGPDRARRRACS